MSAALYLPASPALTDGVFDLYRTRPGLVASGYRMAPAAEGGGVVWVLMPVRPLRGKALEPLRKVAEKGFNDLPLMIGMGRHHFKKLFGSCCLFLAQVMGRDPAQVNEFRKRLGLDLVEVGGGPLGRIYNVGGELIGEDGQKYVQWAGRVCHGDPSACVLVVTGLDFSFSENGLAGEGGE
ncbi:hypothetical protein SAMN05444272_4518 [Roseibium suaedae]|uniref:Uncharacterized protein n=1 Tax=Roseibium suaedae TaxID=735517 RepID=A0A1M7PMF6_9HYPH|nr:hypothetical protein SAMN05444272_4518 [Roseibium suaedae]